MLYNNKKIIIFILILISIFLNPIGIVANNSFTLKNNLHKVQLAKYMEYLIDDSNILDINDISSAIAKTRFIRSRKDKISFGYSNASFWFKLNVKNNQKSDIKWMLEYSYPLVDYISLYIPEKNGFKIIKTGDRLKFSTRPFDYRTFIFPLTTKPGETTYYINIKSQGSLSIELKAWSKDELFNSIKIETPIQWIYIGILLALIFYSIFISFSTEEKAYLYLSLFLTGIGVFNLINNGIAYQYFWGNYPFLGNVLHPVFMSFANIFVLLFSTVFLNTKTFSPKTDKIIKVLISINILFTILSFFIPYHYSTQITVLLAAISTIVMIFIGIKSLFQRLRQAIFYMLSWTAFIIGAFLLVLKVYGILPENFITSWSMQIGSALTALLLSIGVADKINTMRDEKEEALIALRESEEKYKILLENAHEGIILTLDEKPVYANKSMRDLFGYSHDDFFSKSFFDFFADSPTGRKYVSKNYTDRMIDLDVPSKMEVQILTSDEKIIDVILSSSLINIDGKKGIISIITNIHELKKAEIKILHQYEEIQGQYEELEALNEELQSTHFELIEANITIKQEKEQLSATLSSIEEGIISYDKNGDIILLNRIAEKLINFTANTDIAQSIVKAITLLDIKNNTPLSENQKSDILLENNHNKDNIYQIKDNKQNIRTVEIQKTAIKNEYQKESGIVIAIRDITEKQKLEQELFKLNKIESLGVLAGGIAHDLNNLLTAIVGNVSIAKTLVTQGSEISDVLDRVDQACQMTTNFTNQLLTFSKGGSPVKKTSSLVKLIQENADFILSGSDIKSEINLIKNIPPVNIDTEQVSQVFYNLIINAKQASGKKNTITIDIDMIDKLPANIPIEEGKYITISISDEGTGISKDIIGKIFDPYFTTKKTGSGLGLASSFSIIKKHGGHINVESDIGIGTAFTIYLPATDYEIVKKDKKQKKFQKKQGKILILDDNETILDVAKKIFTILGYSVDTAITGEETLEQYKAVLKSKQPYNFIIMDLTIPGSMGGKDTLDKIKEIDPEVFAIVSSGYSDDDIMSNYKANGFKGALLKPYNIEDVKELILELNL